MLRHLNLLSTEVGPIYGDISMTFHVLQPWSLSAQLAAMCRPLEFTVYQRRDTDAPWWACQSATGSETTAFVMDNLFDQSTISTEILTSTGTYNVAYPIQIRWKDGDLRITVPNTGSIGSTTSVSSDTTTTSAPIGASSATNLATSNSVASSSATSSDNGGGGLSNTATIVIGTFIPILTLLAAVPTCYLAIKKLRKRR